MISLYIDTSSSFFYLGLVKNNELLNFTKKSYSKDMSTYALAEIVKVLDKNNIKPDEIDEIIVVNGPGSFTGIRIGITIAKTYAWSLNKNIKTISSLEAMAISNKDNCIKVPLIDARRGYVYAAIFNDNNNVILERQHIKLEELQESLNDLNKEYVYITNDNLNINKREYIPNILEIINYMNDKESINPHSVNPIYLKKTEAEENKGIECL